MTRIIYSSSPATAQNIPETFNQYRETADDLKEEIRILTEARTKLDAQIHKKQIAFRSFLRLAENSEPLVILRGKK
jgi:hypothetical protein